MQKKICIGIDLGTSNSALCYWYEDDNVIHTLPQQQYAGSGREAEAKTLPSVCYLPHDQELSDIPQRWLNDGWVCGNWAKEQSLRFPERAIHSAKSWLCQNQLDPNAEILPLGSELSEKKSPLSAQAYYLHTLKSNFSSLHKEKFGAEPNWQEIDIRLAVPASFDDRARRLTLEAAQLAGFANVSLLEEPQGAFYAWLKANESDWRKKVAAHDLVLVCDIGGGTSDFSLIAVADNAGELQLERISVGRHLLLGGDNMDLTLTHILSQELQDKGQLLTQGQFLSLLNWCRLGKEKLLEDLSQEEYKISLAKSGAKLLGNTISLSLKRSLVEETILSGFFPLSSSGEMPEQTSGSGFFEIGLNYESDPAISKHLALFLAESTANITSDPYLSEICKERLESMEERSLPFVIPNKILFNGGVFKAKQLRERILALFASWGHTQPEVLEHEDLDLAVAKGCCHLAAMKSQGKGLRIHAGTARSYYLGLEAQGLAIPGRKPQLKGLCVVEQGREEGSATTTLAKQFGLVVGRPAKFRFFSSAKRMGDKVGTLVASEELEENACLEVTLGKDEAHREGDLVPVYLSSSVNELGILELAMQDVKTHKSWNLEFNVRMQ